jgi:O-antigen/teichoic acid export membrane protein
MSYKKFARDIGIYGLTQVAAALSGIIILPIITKLLGAQNYGVWTQLLVTVGFLSSIALLGLPYTLVRFLAGEKDRVQIQDGIWSVALIVASISLLFSILLLTFSKPISIFFHCPQTLICLLAIFIFFEFINPVFYNVLRAFQENIKLSALLIFQELGEAGLIVLAIFSGYGLVGALTVALAVRVVIFIILGAYMLKRVGLRMPRFLKIKEYLSFGLPTVPDNLSNWFMQSSDRYLIGYFLGTLFVGYYSSAYTVGVFVINFLIAPFGFLLPAIVSRLYDEQKVDDVKVYLSYSLKYFLVLAIPSVVGLTVLSKQILTILTTAEFAQIGQWIMPVIALSMVPMGINAIVSQIVGIVKKTKIAAMFTTVAAIINVLLNLLLIPKFGIMGAAITTFIAFVFLCLVTWYYSFQYIHFHIDWTFIGKSILASVIMGSAVWWFHANGFIQTMAVVLLGVGIYAILIIAMKGFHQKEIDLLKQFF